MIADVIFLTQRASGETSQVVIRTIMRQTSRFLEKNPGEVKNAKAFQLSCSKLCDCISNLQYIEHGSGEEIIIKRTALDHLLALSNEIEYGSPKFQTLNDATSKKPESVMSPHYIRRSA